jgi:hypothetical protein
MNHVFLNPFSTTFTHPHSCFPPCFFIIHHQTRVSAHCPHPPRSYPPVLDRPLLSRFSIPRPPDHLPTPTRTSSHPNISYLFFSFLTPPAPLTNPHLIPTPTFPTPIFSRFSDTAHRRGNWSTRPPNARRVRARPFSSSRQRFRISANWSMRAPVCRSGRKTRYARARLFQDGGTLSFFSVSLFYHPLANQREKTDRQCFATLFFSVLSADNKTILLFTFS